MGFWQDIHPIQKKKLNKKGENKMSDKDLKILLRAKAVQPSKMGNKANKLSLLKDSMSKDVDVGHDSLSIT